MTKVRRSWYLWGASLTAGCIMLLILLGYELFGGGVPNYNADVILWPMTGKQNLSISHWWDLLGAIIIPMLWTYPILAEKKFCLKGKMRSQFLFPLNVSLLLVACFASVCSLLPIDHFALCPVWSLLFSLQLMAPVAIATSLIDWLILFPLTYKIPIWKL